jgi:isoquinoline 1-oxidoreductase
MNTLVFENGFEPERYELDRPGRGRWAVSRRDFLRRLGGGLVVLLCLDAAIGQESGRPGRGRGGRGNSRPQNLGAWIHIDGKGIVTVYTGKVEVGQNIRTSLTQIVAEELHAPIDSIRMVMGDTQLVPPDAGTFGSRSTPDMGMQLRKVAATARELLLDLAAEQWAGETSKSKLQNSGEASNSKIQAPISQRETLMVRDGRVWKADKSASLSFGELAQDKQLTALVNDKAPTTPAETWTVAGTPIKKVNGSEIVTGRHRYASDQKLMGMVHGKVLRPPRFGATLASLNTSDAEKIQGAKVLKENGFVGVIAPDELTARQALESLRPEWTGGDGISNKELFEQLKSSSQGPKEVVANKIERSDKDGGVNLSASYTVAYIAHTPMEPRAAVASWEGEKLTVFTGTQRPFGVRSELAEAFKMAEDKVRVIMPDTGAGYGGKHSGEAAVDAARLAKLAGKPVKLVWSRAEEFTWAYFRPAGVIDVRGSAKSDGTLSAWEFHNYNSGGSGMKMLYEVPEPKTQFHNSKSPLKQGSYRGLAATANHFARESAMDELAHALKMDPFEFRMKNARDPRLRTVLQAAAGAFGWPRKSSPGHGCGIAGGSEKGSYLATCAEVAVDPTNGAIRVLNVVQAFECGAITNPSHLRSQNEGAIMMGIGGALFEEIKFGGGKIHNASLGEYRVPRFSDLPKIEIVLVNRPDLPSAGAGETPIVGIAPAIGNAVFAASGVRKRAMPMMA